MTYVDQWRLLSGRIRGLVRAGELAARYFAINSEDPRRTGEYLRGQAALVLNELERFQDVFEAELPVDILDTTRTFIAETGPLIHSQSTPGMNEKDQQSAFVRLSAFEAQLSYLMGDNQGIIRTRAERAFSHLQRQIVADSEYREKWLEAFKENEVACEKLGAVHLLLHGIFAFKVNAEGGRTDLVYQEPLEDLSGVRRYADGIVLTEWKRAAKQREVGRRLQEARGQAELYAKDVLAGTELAAHRYAVVVTKGRESMPADNTSDGVTYRHINIAVDPVTPSKERTRLV